MSYEGKFSSYDGTQLALDGTQLALDGTQLALEEEYAKAVPYLERAKNMGVKYACLPLVICYLNGEGDKLYRNLKKAKENFGFCNESEPGYNEYKERIEKITKRLKGFVHKYERLQELEEISEDLKQQLMSQLSMKVFKVQPDHDIIKEFLKNGGDLSLLCNPIEYTRQYPEVLIEVGTKECKKILIDNTVAILLDSGKNLTELLQNFVDGSLEPLLPSNLSIIVENNEEIYGRILGQLTQKWEEQNPEPQKKSESEFADAAAAVPATSSSTSDAAIAAAAEPSASDSSDITDKDLDKTARLLFSYVTLNQTTFGLNTSTSAKTSAKNYMERCAALEQQGEERVQRTMQVCWYLLSNLNEVMQTYKSQKRPNETVSKVINKILAEDGTVQNEGLLEQLGVKITDLMLKQQEQGRSK